MKFFVAYLATCFAGLALAYNSNVFEMESTNANELIKPTHLPKIEVPSDFRMNLNLNTGECIVENNKDIVSTDITVEHPTKIVERIVEKPIIKEVIKHKFIIMSPIEADPIKPLPVKSIKPLCL